MSVEWHHAEEQSLELISDTFNAISESPRLELLHVYNVPLPNALLGRAAESLANAVACSGSIKHIVTNDVRSSNLTLDQVQSSLLLTDKVKSFDLFFKRLSGVTSFGTHFEMFKLACTISPFKRLLPNPTPLNYWPRILKKADTWKRVDSHSPLDFLLCMIREKNDVLLQNVRKHHIRK